MAKEKAKITKVFYYDEMIFSLEKEEQGVRTFIRYNHQQMEDVILVVNDRDEILFKIVSTAIGCEGGGSSIDIIAGKDL